MACPDRLQLPVRLLPEQHDRIAKAAKRKGVSRAAFVLQAAMAACADDEEERRLKKQRKAGFAPDEDDEKKPRSGGLGIRDALTRQTTDEDDEPTSTASAPVVVNVNTNGGSSTANPIVEKLAIFITKGPTYLRDMRRRQCDSIIRTTTSNDEERRQLSAAIDAEVQKIDTKRASVAPSTLEKLKAFLR